jgi:predicted aconitase
MMRTHMAYRGLGAVLSYNCTPYVASNVPNFGEVVAFSESSATPYVNSVWGARSNREGANSALCAAITGYVPEYGLLLDENRKGDILVRGRGDMKGDFEYHLLGYMGKKIGEGIPVFTGFPNISAPRRSPTSAPSSTRRAPTACTTSSASRPRPRRSKRPSAARSPSVGRHHERRSQSHPRRDFAARQPPHRLSRCSAARISRSSSAKHIARKIEAKSFKKEMWILVGSHVKEMADRMGITGTPKPPAPPSCPTPVPTSPAGGI